MASLDQLWQSYLEARINEMSLPFYRKPGVIISVVSVLVAIVSTGFGLYQSKQADVMEQKFNQLMQQQVALTSARTDIEKQLARQQVTLNQKEEILIATLESCHQFATKTQP